MKITKEQVFKVLTLIFKFGMLVYILGLLNEIVNLLNVIAIQITATQGGTIAIFNLLKLKLR